MRIPEGRRKKDIATTYQTNGRVYGITYEMGGNYEMGYLPMMHIGREELYTDLEARIRYLHSFLDFSTSE